MPQFHNVGYVLQGTTAEVAAYTPAAIDAGLYVRDTTLNIDYWIDPDGLGLIPRKVAPGTAYSGFSLTDGTTTGTNVGDGDSASILGGAFIQSTVVGTTATLSLDGSGQVQGHGLFVDNAGAFQARAPITIGTGSTNYLNFNVATGELTATPTLINTWTDATQATLAAFVAAEYTAGNEFQLMDAIRTTDGSIYVHNGGTAGTIADFTQINNGTGGMSTFTIAGDAGTPNSIGDNETLTFIGGVNVRTTVGANSVQFDAVLKLGALDDVPANPGVGDFALINNNGVISYQLLTDENLGNANLTADANRSYTLDGNTLTYQLSGASSAVFAANGITMNSANLRFGNGNGQIKTSPDGTEWIESITNSGQPIWTSI